LPCVSRCTARRYAGRRARRSRCRRHPDQCAVAFRPVAIRRRCSAPVVTLLPRPHRRLLPAAAAPAAGRTRPSPGGPALFELKPIEFKGAGTQGRRYQG
jgi:hypothetical protein